ncbi:hypothetical protein ACLBWT_12145 [Paenibacillus sp. D51F]
MLKLEIAIRNRTYHQSRYEEDFFKKQIVAGNVQAIGYCFRKGCFDEVRERDFLAPQPIVSMKQAIEYLAKMERSKLDQNERVCLVAEMVNKVEGNYIDVDRFEISLADKNGKSCGHEDLEIYKPLYVLIREKGTEGAAREIEKMMANERYFISINCWGEFVDLGANNEVIVPDFELTINVAGDSGEKKESIRQSILSTFDVIEYQEANGELRFTTYGGEGPFVYDIGDVISVACEKFGPEIDKRMASIGLTDYKVIFSVNECIC